MLHVLSLILATTLTLFVALWIFGIWYVNDFSVPTRRSARVNNVLVIFPHPDDETNIAGTLWRLHTSGATVTLAVLTTGECGTPDAHVDLTLKTIRSAEMRTVCTLLGTELRQEDMGDSQIAANHVRVETYIDSLLSEIKPDLVITYDLAGLYGHEDHITCSEITTRLIRERYPRTKLWYAALPERMLKAANLPTEMAKDTTFHAKRAHANLRLFVGPGVIRKIRAVYAHKSQRTAFQRSVPAKLPLWLVYSLGINEYFEVVR